MEQAPRDGDQKREEAWAAATPAAGPPRPGVRVAWGPAEVWAVAREPAVVPDRARAEAVDRAAAGDLDKAAHHHCKNLTKLKEVIICLVLTEQVPWEPVP